MNTNWLHIPILLNSIESHFQLFLWTSKKHVLNAEKYLIRKVKTVSHVTFNNYNNYKIRFKEKKLLEKKLLNGSHTKWEALHQQTPKRNSTMI